MPPLCAGRRRRSCCGRARRRGPRGARRRAGRRSRRARGRRAAKASRTSSRDQWRWRWVEALRSQRSSAPRSKISTVAVPGRPGASSSTPLPFQHRNRPSSSVTQALRYARQVARERVDVEDEEAARGEGAGHGRDRAAQVVRVEQVVDAVVQAGDEVELAEAGEVRACRPRRRRDARRQRLRGRASSISGQTSHAGHVVAALDSGRRLLPVPQPTSSTRRPRRPCRAPGARARASQRSCS